LNGKFGALSGLNPAARAAGKGAKSMVQRRLLPRHFTAPAQHYEFACAEKGIFAAG